VVDQCLDNAKVKRMDRCGNERSKGITRIWIDYHLLQKMVQMQAGRGAKDWGRSGPGNHEVS
jgi:hypothetical protein